MISHEAEKQFSDLADSVWQGNATIIECLDEEGRTYPVICMVQI